MRRTKIVATLGPATRGRAALDALIEAGADVVRLNLAHASLPEHEEALTEARAAAAGVGRIVGVLVDLPGPKMRTGNLERDEIELRPGEPFVLTNESVTGDWESVSTTVPNLAALAAIDEEIFLADGEIVLRVTELRGDDVVTEVVRGGTLRPRKGMHLPSAERKVQAFTDQDAAALKHAVSWKADLVGLSFVRDAEDVERARAALPKRGHRPMIVAKIETSSAVENLSQVVQAADAVMVARGDLGIQLPFSAVPQLQKRIINEANLAGKPVITATQMLESMTRAPLPTRAEVADVATAIHDGTDAVMLSEETAVGSYPSEAVRAMSQIAVEAEATRSSSVGPEKVHLHDDPVSWAVAHAAVEAAEDLNVAAIVCPTRSGSTALRVAAYRPSMPIVGLSPDLETLGPLALCWGVSPLRVEQPGSGGTGSAGPQKRSGTGSAGPQNQEDWTAESDVARATRAVREAGFAVTGDLVAVVAGSPGKRAGRTDYVRVARVD